MTRESAHKDTLDFMNTIDEKGLFQPNPEYMDKESLDNFTKFVNAFSNTYSELGKKATSFDTEFDEVMIFFIYSEVSFVITNLELVKKLLKYLVNPKLLKDGFDEDTTLGKMIYKICKKLEYSDTLWTATFNLFHVDFRNAIAHHHYLISKDGITIYPNNEEKKRDYSIEQLKDDTSNIQGILNGLGEFVNMKTAEINAIAEEKESKTEELIKQKEELDRKLRDLR